MSLIVKNLSSFLKLLLSPFLFIYKKVFSLKFLHRVDAALQNPDIRKKIFITMGIVIIFRVLAAIPLPGIDPEVYQAALGSSTGSAFSSLWTLATGGNLDSPSLVVIGLGAYINSSIMIQLLTTVVPKLEELSKEGESGRKVINQITRFLTLPLSLLQGFVIYTIIKNNTQLIPGSGFSISELVTSMNSQEVAIMILSIAAGSVFLMWLSELITENGLGNGSSVIIMVGILATVPGLFTADFTNTFQFIRNGITSGDFSVFYSDSALFLYLIILGLVAMVVSIVFVNEAIRRIPIQYARRVRGVDATQSSYLPFKLTQAGVMPIIFASSVLTFPTIIAQFITGTADPGSRVYEIAINITNLEVFNFRSYQYLILYFVLIFFFAFFYTFVVMKPEDTSENLQKSGGFIPGIRPGNATTKFITSTLVRLTFVGAIFLALLAVIPSLVRLTDQGADLLIFTGIGGTSLLIIVSVILDTLRQAKSFTLTRSYEMYK